MDTITANAINEQGEIAAATEEAVSEAQECLEDLST